MKEQSVSPIQQQKNIFLVVLLARFDLAFVSQWPAGQSALGITQAWTISLLKGLLLGDVPVKLASPHYIISIFNDDNFAKFST